MDSSGLVFGILPLFIFVLVDSFVGLKYALISAIILTLIEAILGLYLFKEIDSVTIFSIFSVIVLALISYKMKSPLFIKFQPVVLSVILGLSLLISYWMEKPLLVSMITKYQHQMPQNIQERIHDPIVMALFKESTLFVGYTLIAHGAVTAFTALKLSNWWWLFMRAVGFYFFLALGMGMATWKIAHTSSYLP